MFKKILVPLDGSEISESVLKYAVGIATGCNVPLVVLVRVREILDANVIATMDPTIVSELDQSYHDEAAVYLEDKAVTLREKGVNVEIDVLSGNPAEEIIEYTKKKGVDLIIMSTRGRSGVSRLVFGSIADKITKHSPVPVLINPAGNK